MMASSSCQECTALCSSVRQLHTSRPCYQSSSRAIPDEANKQGRRLTLGHKLAAKCQFVRSIQQACGPPAAHAAAGSHHRDCSWTGQHVRPETSAPMRATSPTGEIWPAHDGWKRACVYGSTANLRGQEHALISHWPQGCACPTWYDHWRNIGHRRFHLPPQICGR